jgi:hypothetical protein
MSLRGQPPMSKYESGFALLLTLIALSLLSLLGLFMTFNSNTGVKISDNYETQIQATYAALAGLNHARALIRGIALDDLLKGPDGTYNDSASYLSRAKRFDFRNPHLMTEFYSLDVAKPTILLSGTPDDGFISTGYYGGADGTVLIPASGIGLSAANPYGPGEIVTSRYFVKVTDNNGDASEISGDSSDNPFVDGDGIVTVRSVGVSKTFFEATGTLQRRNSVAVFEARFKRMSTFDTGPALVVLGTEVEASFEGAFEISGNLSPGIGTIDTLMSDTSYPESIVAAAAGARGLITGGGRPSRSIQEISGDILSDRDKALLLDPRFLWDFIHTRAPKIADVYFDGNQSWSGDAPYAGSYDSTRPWNAPGQDPKITVVNGDLHVTGGFTGGGLLIVTGTLSYTGPFAYIGLVLVMGAGLLAADGSGPGIEGGLLVASLDNSGGTPAFGIPIISVAGSSRLSANRDVVKMALGLVPVSQISFREIAGSDP